VIPTYDIRCADGHEEEVLTSVEDCACPCPICGKVTERVWRAKRRAIIPDDIPGGFVQENFGDQPETFYSWSAMARRAEQLQLEPRIRYAGPGDRACSNWDVPSAYTLEQAAILVARVAEQSTASDPAVRCETLQMSIRTIPCGKG
jgi:hypothetical protein